MSNIYYFGYGSNLHPDYMELRLSNSIFLDVGKLNNYKLLFNKLGKDGSGKANITPYKNEKVLGSVYLLSQEKLAKLGKQEKGYKTIKVPILLNSKEIEAFTYQAESNFISDVKPFSWYLDLVLLGANKVNLNEEYIVKIKSIDTESDLNKERQKKYNDIIRSLNV